jgi:hypothetical protein
LWRRREKQINVLLAHPGSGQSFYSCGKALDSRLAIDAQQAPSISTIPRAQPRGFAELPSLKQISSYIINSSTFSCHGKSYKFILSHRHFFWFSIAASVFRGVNPKFYQARIPAHNLYACFVILLVLDRNWSG